MKLYLNNDPGIDLYLEIQDQPELVLKAVTADELYLDLEKANTHKEPVRGQFMTGGKQAKGTEDQQDIIDKLFARGERSDIKKVS